MAHIDDKVIELARTALSFELGGEHFYRHAAGITQNARGKAMFQRLAEEENGRMEDLHTLFSAIIGAGEWQRLVAEETASVNPSAVVSEMETTVANRGHGVVADDTQALRMAMEMQRKVIHLYKSLASHTEDAVVAGLIAKMIEEENFQYDNFQAQLDSVLNVGLWLDSPEFRMDGKF
ncbi:MAG: ferritin family protein [Sulfuricellaceae bacterium]